MNNQQLAETFFDKSLRYEAIIFLAAMCGDYCFPEAAENAFEDDTDEVYAALGLEIPEDFDYQDKDEIASFLHRNGKTGFLVKVATQCPSNFSDDGSSHSTNGWGHYTTTWLYGETLEEIAPRALEWRDSYIQKKFATSSKG